MTKDSKKDVLISKEVIIGAIIRKASLRKPASIPAGAVIMSKSYENLLSITIAWNIHSKEMSNNRNKKNKDQCKELDRLKSKN